MIITKKVSGEVDLNDGEFVEVQTIGVEGIEKVFVARFSDTP